MALNKNQKIALIGGGILLLAIFGKRIFQSKGAKTGQAGMSGDISQDGKKVTYKVPTWALGYLVNYDKTGLSEDEIQQIDYFASDVKDEDTGNDPSAGRIVSEPYFSWKNDVVDGIVGDEVVDFEVRTTPEYTYAPRP